jgi:dsRNA-specific ribonuclease
VLGAATGRAKKEAEQEAAREALTRLAPPNPQFPTADE